MLNDNGRHSCGSRRHSPGSSRPDKETPAMTACQSTNQPNQLNFPDSVIAMDAVMDFIYNSRTCRVWMCVGNVEVHIDRLPWPSLRWRTNQAGLSQQRSGRYRHWAQNSSRSSSSSLSLLHTSLRCFFSLPVPGIRVVCGLPCFVFIFEFGWFPSSPS